MPRSPEVVPGWAGTSLLSFPSVCHPMPHSTLATQLVPGAMAPPGGPFLGCRKEGLSSLSQVSQPSHQLLTPVLFWGPSNYWSW